MPSVSWIQGVSKLDILFDATHSELLIAEKKGCSCSVTFWHVYSTLFTYLKKETYVDCVFIVPAVFVANIFVSDEY
jgi:hypothetical protein